MKDLLLLGDEEDDSTQMMTAADLSLLDASFQVVDNARWTLSASLSLALSADPERHVAFFPNIGARNYRYLTSVKGPLVQWPMRRPGACWSILK